MYYFGCKVGDQDKSWAPHVCHTVCYSGLTQWLNGKRKAMPFAVPMIWWEPKSPANDCYFCMTNIAGYTKKNKWYIVDCETALRPVPHDSENVVPLPPECETSDEEPHSTDEVVDDTEDVFEAVLTDENLHLLQQAELNDLIRDLQLSKEKSELLASRLKEWNLLDRTRHVKLASFYAMENDACYCSDVNGLMHELGYDHIPDEWRLFIDSGKDSLKAVLLHYGNEKPSVPVALAHGLKETSTAPINGISVEIWKLYLFSLGFNLGIQSKCVSYVCGTVVMMLITTKSRTGQNRVSTELGSTMWNILHW